MNTERDENYRLICAKRGTHWWVELRTGAWWAVGSPSEDLDTAIQSAREKFAADHPQVRVVFDGSQGTNPVIKPVCREPVITKQSKTDLSDLLQ